MLNITMSMIKSLFEIHEKHFVYIQCSKSLPCAIYLPYCLYYPTNDLILHCLLLLNINYIMYMNVVVMY